LIKTSTVKLFNVILPLKSMLQAFYSLFTSPTSFFLIFIHIFNIEFLKIILKIFLLNNSTISHFLVNFAVKLFHLILPLFLNIFNLNDHIFYLVNCAISSFLYNVRIFLNYFIFHQLIFNVVIFPILI
jgi:hypothetical protein